MPVKGADGDDDVPEKPVTTASPGSKIDLCSARAFAANSPATRAAVQKSGNFFLLIVVSPS